jgi:hypothetical protein
MSLQQKARSRAVEVVKEPFWVPDLLPSPSGPHLPLWFLAFPHLSQLQAIHDSWWSKSQSWRRNKRRIFSETGAFHLF